MEISITHIDTACILLQIGEYKILTDPVLDQPGQKYHHGFGAISSKTERPAMDPQALKGIDLLLLSHHQHWDNFDAGGRMLAAEIPLVLSTKAAGKALPYVTGLSPWEQFKAESPKIKNLRITATPAQHHPWWLPEFFSGPATGFLLEFDGQTKGAWYISGDTVYFQGLAEIGKKFEIDLGVFHLGSAQFPYLSGPGRFTMNAADLSKANAVLAPKRIIPIHFSGWSHFKEQEQALRRKLGSLPELQGKMLWLEPGRQQPIPL